MPPLTLILHPQRVVVAQLPQSGAEVSPLLDPTLVSLITSSSPLGSITFTPEEVSLVLCETPECTHYLSQMPGSKVEVGWRALRVSGVLDFSLVGILSSLLLLLAAAKVSVFTLSTYNTDFILVKESDLDSAIIALKDGNNEVTMVE